MIEPAHPFQGSELDSFQGAPWPMAPNDFDLAEVVDLTLSSRRALERRLQGCNARRQRVLNGRAPNDDIRARLRRLPKALVVAEEAKDVSPLWVV